MRYPFLMDKETLKYVLGDSATRKLPATVARTLQLPLGTPKIVTLVGIRRSGKTYLLYETMRRLALQGVDRRQMVYVNFEDDRLLPIKPRELDLILRAHNELYPEFAPAKKYLFFDEVQNAPRWEWYVRRLHDTENIQIFLTGSSSHLLAREIATSLRGRSITYEVFPLSFREYLAFRNLEVLPYSRTADSQMAAALSDYLSTGGLPEVVLAPADLRSRILKEYVELVFYKDLVDRYKVANPMVLRQLLKRCLGQPASLLSAHRIYNDFRSQGLEVSKDTLYNYLRYMEESYLVFFLPIADRSVRKQAMNPKKTHAIDWALGYPLVAEQTIDVGRKLETAVFLHWRRQREDLGYIAGAREIDLVVNREHPEMLINVALSVAQSSTWEREIAALESTAINAPTASRVLVTAEQTDRAAPKGIQIIEAWRYLLE